MLKDYSQAVKGCTYGAKLFCYLSYKAVRPNGGGLW